MSDKEKKVYKQVVIMQGIPGSGKSTYVAKHYPDAHVCSADKFHMKSVGEAGVGGDTVMVGDMVYDYDSKRAGEAHRWCMAQFGEALKSEAETIVVDNTNISPTEHGQYRVVAEVAGYEIKRVQIRVTTLAQLSKCIRRCVHRVPEDRVTQMAMDLHRHNNEEIAQSKSDESVAGVTWVDPIFED